MTNNTATDLSAAEREAGNARSERDMDPLELTVHRIVHDEKEWRALEKERATLGWEFGKPVACGVKHSDRAHPLSYRPDLPLRAAAIWTVAGKDALTRTTAKERKALAARQLTLFVDGGQRGLVRDFICAESEEVRSTIRNLLPPQLRRVLDLREKLSIRLSA